MLSNNKKSYILIKDPKSQNYTKYIDVMHYYIWKLVDKKKLGIKSISSSLIFADRL